MPNGDAETDAIREGLVCPECDYSLRGLPGAIVNCPECGHRCDLVRMIQRKWTMPWKRAPGFALLVRPVAWLSLTGIVGVPGVLLLDMQRRMSGQLALVALALIVAVWMWLVRRAARQYADGRGYNLTMRLHGIMLGYLGSLAGILALVVFCLTGVAKGQPILLLIGVIGCAALAWLFWRFRCAERSVGEICLDRYLDGWRPG